MRNAHRFKNTTKPEFVEKGGVNYRVVDVGGMRMKIRVKEDKEVKRDTELFKLYISGPDPDCTPLP